jgi:hypothetical protein
MAGLGSAAPQLFSGLNILFDIGDLRLKPLGTFRHCLTDFADLTEEVIVVIVVAVRHGSWTSCCFLLGMG